MIDDFDLEKDFEVKKLVIVISKGKTYHYWRKASNINKRNIFYIRIGDMSYILKNGKLIDDWSDCLDAIQLEELKKTRNWKIKRLFNNYGI